MIQIANPLYDVVFKGLMENEPAAKILLGALLGKKIVRLEPGRNEFTNEKVREFSIYRIDFSAIVKDETGSEERITIEIQKTWAPYEVGRFRNYIAKQYSAAENRIIVSDGKTERAIGRPMVSIYILGHLLPQVQDTVVYVKRFYLNHLKEVIDCKDDFIESLSHDSIIVQVPLLPGRTGTRVENILSVFNQRLATPGSDNHRLDYDANMIEEQYRTEIEPLVRCLTRMASDIEVQEVMNEEDYYLSEMEFNNQVVERKNKIIEEQQEVLAQNKQALKQKDLAIEQGKQELEQRNFVIEQSKQQLRENQQQLEQKELEIEKLRALLANAQTKTNKE